MKISLTAHQRKFISRKMKGGGYLSKDEVVREALRVYELTEHEDGDPALETQLRQALRGPRKKYEPGHFAALASRSGRRAAAA